MKQSEQGSILTPVLYFWLFIIIVGTIGYVMWTNKEISDQSANIETTEQTVSQPAGKGDINRDGKIDEIDRNYIRSQLSCKNGDTCWATQVGKTSDGDNPFYTSDLDLNADGTITEADIP